MVTDETEEDSKLPPDARLGSLEERLDKAQQVEGEKIRKRQPDPAGRTSQLLFGHLIGAPFGGGLIGWGLDSLFGTFPVFFLLLLFLILPLFDLKIKRFENLKILGWLF